LCISDISHLLLVASADVQLSVVTTHEFSQANRVVHFASVGINERHQLLHHARWRPRAALRIHVAVEHRRT
jgi:hypothetical protein